MLPPSLELREGKTDCAKELAGSSFTQIEPLEGDEGPRFETGWEHSTIPWRNPFCPPSVQDRVGAFSNSLGALRFALPRFQSGWEHSLFWSKVLFCLFSSFLPPSTYNKQYMAGLH